MPGTDQTLGDVVPVPEVQWTTAVIAAIVIKGQASVGKPQQKVRTLSGGEEVELFGIESYDKHD